MQSIKDSDQYLSIQRFGAWQHQAIFHAKNKFPKHVQSGYF